MNTSNDRKPKAGDWVEIRSEQEILKTLDEDGRLEGMPFMPEMLAFCGRKFMVTSRAHKTCDTVFPVRSRKVSRAVHLGTRCDGSAHGGCQAQCLIFWKEAWLKPVDQGAGVPSADAERAGTTYDARDSTGISREQLEKTVARIDQQDGAPIYSCQATQLPYATTDLQWWDIRQYIEDYTSGNVSIWRLFNGAVYSMYYNLSQAGIGLGRPMRWLYDRLHTLWRGTPWPRRPGIIPQGQPTPTESLGLQVGDLVRVRSQAEILETVTTDNKNRGMVWDAELVPYCGGTYKVQTRVTRLIDEKTGRMLDLKNPCLILEGVVCQARFSNCRMFCPRAIYPYWREIWLRKVTDR